MILTFDTESQGFTKQFICGSLTTENEQTFQTRSKTRLWNKILEIAQTEKKQGHNTYAYAHNLKFDIGRILPTQIQKNEYITIKAAKPFILEYGHNNEPPHLHFYDTTALLPLSLENIGKFTNTPKTKIKPTTQEKLYSTQKQEYTWEEQKEIADYNLQDTKALIKAIQWIKERLKENNLKPRRLITIGAISMMAFNKQLRNTKNWQKFYEWSNFKKGQLNTNHYYKPSNEELILNGYRGGRIQTIQTGKFENCTLIDASAWYPKMATITPMPNLQQYTQKEQPTLKDIQKHNYGLTKCALKKTTNQLGIIPIKWKDQQNETKTEYPEKKGTTLIGTWTNKEITYATQNGYKLLTTETMTAHPTLEENILGNLMKEWYKKRINEEPTKQIFYKLLMNNLISKFGQRKTTEELEEGQTDDKQEMLQKGYTIQGKIERQNNPSIILFSKEQTNKRPNHYAPIIPCQITAAGRIELHKKMTQIPKKDLLYTNTDGILYKGNHNITNKETKNPTENTMGNWQKTRWGNALIYGNGRYMINDYIIASGMKLTKEKNKTLQDFKKGTIQYQKMKRIDIHKIQELGEFKTYTEDLKKQTTKWQQRTEELKEQTLIIDEKETKLQHFIKEGIL